jgi:hypothetical protein
MLGRAAGVYKSAYIHFTLTEINHSYAEKSLPQARWGGSRVRATLHRASACLAEATTALVAPSCM